MKKNSFLLYIHLYTFYEEKEELEKNLTVRENERRDTRVKKINVRIS